MQEELRILGRVESLSRELGEKDRKLEEKETSLAKSKSTKEALRKERDEMKLKLMINEEKSSILQKEKETLEQKLKSQSETLQLLERPHDAMLQQHDVHHLQEVPIIRRKKEKIEKLRKKLAKVKQELESEKAVTQDLRNKVSQLENELRQKMAEAHSYEIDVLKTKYELEGQRHELDQLNQLQVANSNQKTLLQEVQVSV